MSNDKIKEALKLVPYGFYAITSSYENDNNAMVANWLTQVSFDPRSVAVAIQKQSHSLGLIEKGGSFNLNIFRSEDKDLLMPFTKSRSRKADKMAEALFSESPVTRLPVLDGAAAFVECEVTRLVDFDGDHVLVIGKVVGAEVLIEGTASDTLTLADLGWSYAG